MKSPRFRSRRSLVIAMLTSAMLPTSAVLLTDVATSDTGGVAVAEASPRDPWLRPFSSTSIWNMPLGSRAEYKPANMPYTSRHAIETSYLMKTTSSDPLQPILETGSWRDRCSGTRSHGTRVHLPDGWQPKPVTETSTPNNPAVFLQPDGRTLVNVGATARCDPTGPLHANRPSDDKHITDLYGDGIKGAHGASRLSQLGGAIRPGELSGDEPIAHALDLLIWAEHLYWGGTKESSYRWPASSSDRYAGPDEYRGSDPELRMGSLLAIPPGATPENLGITTDVGRKLFDALQDYGAYVTDDSAWDATYLGVDHNAVGTFEWGSAEQEDMARLVMELNVITNNTAQSVGGGGSPRQPLLPPLSAERPTGGPKILAPTSGPAPTACVESPRVGAGRPVAADPPAGEMTFADSFDDGPSALEQRTLPRWTSYGGRFVVSGGSASVAGGSESVLAVLDASTQNVVIESSVTLSPKRAAIGLSVRALDRHNVIVLSMVIRDGQNRVSLHSVVNGRYTKLAELNGANLRLGQTYDVVLTANGRDLDVVVDGRRVLRHQLSDVHAVRFANGTMHGLRMMRSSDADDGESRWNDVTVRHL